MSEDTAAQNQPTPTESKKKRIEYDPFISTQIFPDAVSLFEFQLRTLEEIKPECHIVIDTNALLVPYRVEKRNLAEIRETYRRVVESRQLIIPGQVAREFVKNRAGRISELYQQLIGKIDAQGLPKLDKSPLLETIKEFNEAIEISKEVERLTKEYRNKLKEVLEHIKRWTWNDPVSLIYRELFTNEIVLDPSFEAAPLQIDLDRRTTHAIPPGYKDKGAGDMLIWHTILHIAKTNKKDVIFVSGDEKADWWYQSVKQNLYPRYELVDEFRRASEGKSFHIVSFSGFLKLYGASKEVVEQVRNEEEQAHKAVTPFLGNPDAYIGIVETIYGEIRSVRRAAKELALDPIVERFGTWAVTSYGLECLSTEYQIPKDRLDEPDWIDHMSSKTWIKMRDFVHAFRAAKTYHNLNPGDGEQ